MHFGGRLQNWCRSKHIRQHVFRYYIFFVSLAAKIIAATGKENCTGLLDMTIMLDMSGSVGKPNWNNVVIPFVKGFLSNMDIGEEAVRTALVLYDYDPIIQWKLDKVEYYDKEALLGSVDNLKDVYGGGGTYTGEALAKMKDAVIFGPGGRDDAPKLVVIVTDGKSSDSVLRPSAEIRGSAGVIFVIGVAKANPAECRVMAGCEAHDIGCPRYKEADWDSLVSQVNNITKVVCETLPTDAICNEWAEWSPCSNSCGKGIKRRERKSPLTLREQIPGSDGKAGKTCQEQIREYNQSSPCKVRDCPVDARCGSFSSWTPCTKSCDGGTRKRTRLLWNDPPAQFGGRDCESQGLQESEIQTCNDTPCPIDALPGDWGDWTPCSAACGWGTRTRERLPEKVRAEHGGLSIEKQGFALEEREICQNFSCSPCEYHLAEWSSCTQTCGEGYKSRNRTAKFDYPADICPNKLYEEANCTLPVCDVLRKAHETVLPEQLPDKEETGNAGVIAGGVVGGCAFVAGGAAAYYFFLHKAAVPLAQGGTPDSFGEAMERNVEMNDLEEMVPIDADYEAWAS